MRLVIMQPYLFPYIGYFQLLKSCDKFIFYDDVNFIKGGWINRNRILVNGKDHMFSVPLKNISSYNLINQTEINKNQYTGWYSKFLKTVEQNYKKAPYFYETITIITEVLDEPPEYISDLASKSIITVASYLKLPIDFVTSSTIYNNSHLRAAERVLDICTKESASIYINTIAGKELYTEEEFSRNSMHLKFLKTGDITYKQFNNEFIPWLSIIDLMMFNPIKVIHQFLDRYELL
ncbi:MAG: WbqC family protein [Candidatus Latescibacteria bacterium]|nr:WbqC family protein [Candidatus Latescibacterota bacterium]